MRLFQSSGTMNWSVSGTDDYGCQLQGSGSLDIEPWFGSLYTQNDLIGGPDYRTYDGGGCWVDVPVTYICPGSISTLTHSFFWYQNAGLGDLVANDGITAEGSYSDNETDPGGARHWTWEFTARTAP